MKSDLVVFLGHFSQQLELLLQQGQILDLYLLIGFRKSTPPQNRQLIVNYY